MAILEAQFSTMLLTGLQFHELLKDTWGDDDHSPDLLWLLEWIICTPCALRDAHNAFKYSIKGKFDNGELMRCIFIGVASVRNSMDVILTYLGEWVSLSLLFAPALDDAETPMWRSLWHTPGCEAYVIHLLVDVLEMRFRNDKLLVKEGSPLGDCTNRICSTLLAVWKDRKFCDSRWLSVGKSASSMVASRVTGLGGLLEFAEKNLRSLDATSTVFSA
jgi:hypothetical protein